MSPAVSYIFWLFFLLSGVSALIYEILWVRFFALSIGSTIYSASAVTAAYMGGLAIGAYMPGRYADRVASPLKYYAIFELLIGAYALLFMFFSGSIDAAGVSLSTIVSKFAFVIAVLIVPTLLMGATLPFVSTAYVRIFRPANKEFAVSLLYGINALGGVFGIFLAGFYLIFMFGNTVTTLIAVAGNFIVAALAFFISSKAVKGEDETVPAETGAPRRPALKNTAEGASGRPALYLFINLAGFFVTGFCALALEIVLARLLVLIIGTSTYAFSIILM
ncbi:MAG TPA: fused MFS/spermidine synthase, partial [Candidatus Wallbacteria bacterium]|nr:fused MFS/spermidine synthase [Candidatus Wallbacteria bacterium]